MPAIIIAAVVIQIKYNENILFIYKLIDKSLLLKNFFSTTLFLNLNVSAKTFLLLIFF